MTTLNEEDSARLLADLENCCTPEEAARRSFEAQVHINRVLVGAESAVLCASPIACAVADAFAYSVVRLVDEYELPSDLLATLSAIELVTRESPLRKVRP